MFTSINMPALISIAGKQLILLPQPGRSKSIESDDTGFE